MPVEEKVGNISHLSYQALTNTTFVEDTKSFSNFYNPPQRTRYQRKPINMALCLSNDIKMHPRYGHGDEKYGRDIKIYVYPTCRFKAPQTIGKYATAICRFTYTHRNVRLSKRMWMVIGNPR